MVKKFVKNSGSHMIINWASTLNYSFSDFLLISSYRKYYILYRLYNQLSISLYHYIKFCQLLDELMEIKIEKIIKKY